MIRIHNFARGVRGQRVMWQCEEMGLPYQVERVGYPTPDSYRELNPLGTVPFLQDDGGVAMNESVAMMFYLAQRYGPTPLLAGYEGAELARLLQLTEFGEATLGAGLNPLLMARFAAPAPEKHGWLVLALEGRVAEAVRFVSTMLGERTFLMGDRPALADLSVGPMLGIWQGVLHQELAGNLSAYLERIRSRPAYERARLRCEGTVSGST
ncbi:MAG TPA: glutathione S-transferase family protein [Steroidobacteraceae bacterium]|nr:glutathione S-transferase family protein [Steroidobacteraceae bacterium]